MFRSLKYHLIYGEINHYFRTPILRHFSERFLKSQCYFTFLYYKTSPPNFNTNAGALREEDSKILEHWVTRYAYGFTGWDRRTESTITYCVVLYHACGDDDDDDNKPNSILNGSWRMHITVALIYLPSNSSIKSGQYAVYCKTPTSGSYVATSVVTYEASTSMVNPEFMDSCSYTDKLVGLSEGHVSKGRV